MDKKRPSTKLLIVGGLLMVVGIWILYTLAVKCQWETGKIGETGQFGDSFGALNTLFAGLAFVGVIATLYKQHVDGMEADERHDENIQAQSCITRVQGLTALMQAEEAALEASKRRLRFIHVLRRRFDICVSLVGKDEPSNQWNEISNLVQDSLLHLNSGENTNLEFQLEIARTSIQRKHETYLSHYSPEENKGRQEAFNQAVADARRVLDELVNSTRNIQQCQLMNLMDFKAAISREISSLESKRKAEDSSPAPK